MRIAYILSFGLLLAACKKETEQAPSPHTRIASFKVEAGEEMMMAAMSGDSIVMYWPFHIATPESIQPQIEVSEGATLSPASGASVPFRTGTAYTVKAQNGTEKKYFLKVVLNQAPIQISETGSYIAERGGEFVTDIGSTMRYFVADPAVTSFYLVDTPGTATKMDIEFFTPQNGIPNIRVKIPETGLKPGAYRVRITCGEQSRTTENYVFGVLYKWSESPKVTALAADVTVKRGETITFSGSNFFDLKDAVAYTYDANYLEKEIMPLPFVSSTATTATYRIPDNFPAGTYQFGDWGPGAMGIRLRITDFTGWWSWNGNRKNYVEVTGFVKFTVEP